MINKLHEKALRIILNNKTSNSKHCLLKAAIFSTIIKYSNTYDRSIKKTKQPMLERKTIPYNLRNSYDSELCS